MRKSATFLILLMIIIGTNNAAFASGMPQYYIHPNTHTAELKPIQHSFQLAKSTFLPDRFDDLGLSDYDTLHDDYNYSSCIDYTLSSCPAGSFCEKCPFDTTKLRVYSCKSPYIISKGNCICPPAVTITYPNDKCLKYCGSICIQKTCIPTPSTNNCTNETKNCDNGCGQNTRLCCLPCTNKTTTKPKNSTYIYETCHDDNGSQQIQIGWTCNSGYHETNGTCEKDCISTPCSGYSLTSCPSGYTCDKCTKTATNCSTDGTYYKIINCPAGQIDLNNYWCGGLLKCFLPQS